MVGNGKKQRIAAGIAINTMGRLILDARTDIIDHPYIIVLDIWELNRQREKMKRRTRLVNNYNNNIRADQVWSPVGSATRHWALAEGEWTAILLGRTVFLGDFKAHSPQWNMHCREQRDVVGLEAIIKTYSLIYNNEPGREIRPTRS